MPMVLEHPPAHLLRAIRSEFDEMPGMRLTRGQFQRLWHLDDELCDRAILELTGRGYLSRDADGRLCRATDEIV